MDKKLCEKLLKLQKTVGAIEKDSENPFFKSKYFDINKLLEVVKPELSKLGLIILQPLTAIDHHAAIKTLLIDSETGEEIVNITPLTENPDPQKMGSAITYFRRYSLQSLLGLQAEDDDGNNAAGKKVDKYVNKPQRKKATSKKFIPEKSKDIAISRIKKGFEYLRMDDKEKQDMHQNYLSNPGNLYMNEIRDLNKLLQALEKKAKE